MLTIIDSLGTAVDFGIGAIIGIAVATLAITAVFYVLRSLGLYVMAKKQHYKNAYIAWIPLAWIYIAGKLCKANNVFGFKIKNFTVFLTVFFIISEVITLTFSLMQYIPLAGYLLECSAQGKTALIGYSMSEQFMFNPEFYSPYQLMNGVYLGNDFTFRFSAGIIRALNIINIFSLIIDIFNMVLLFTMYFHLFRTYWPQHYFSAFIFSIFGLFPAFVFALRKKDPVNYEEYVKARYGDYMARRNQYYNDPYMNGGNNPNNTYNNGTQNNGANSDPFSEFGASNNNQNGEPFGEYNQGNQDPFSEFDKKDGDK